MARADHSKNGISWQQDEPTLASVLYDCSLDGGFKNVKALNKSQTSHNKPSLLLQATLWPVHTYQLVFAAREKKPIGPGGISAHARGKNLSLSKELEFAWRRLRDQQASILVHQQESVARQSNRWNSAVTRDGALERLSYLHGINCPLFEIVKVSFVKEIRQKRNSEIYL